MPTIKFTKNNREVIVSRGVNLRQALLDSGLPVASSCSGEGVCGKCWVKVMSGEDTLLQPNETEEFLKSKMELGPIYRISCQVTVEGDLVLDAPYW